MTATQLHEWIKAKHGRGTWLAAQLGISRQSLNSALVGRWPNGIETFKAKGLRKLLAKRERAEEMMI